MKHVLMSTLTFKPSKQKYTEEWPDQTSFLNICNCTFGIDTIALFITTYQSIPKTVCSKTKNNSIMHIFK